MLFVFCDTRIEELGWWNEAMVFITLRRELF